MTRKNRFVILTVVLTVYISSVILTINSAAAQGTPEVAITVANTRMGPLFALADLTLREYKQGNYETASTLARILNRVWNNAETSRSDGLSVTNPPLWAEIDEAMDNFLEPIARGKRPDVTTVLQAHDTYVAELRKAE